MDLSSFPILPNKGAVKYVIYTKQGPGPQVLSNEDSLLNSDGVPESVWLIFYIFY